jgi:hypothetical protein
MPEKFPDLTTADERCRSPDKGTGDNAARVALIERSILILLVFGLFIGVLAVVKPFTIAILFGAALATAAWPIRQALVRQGLARADGRAPTVAFARARRSADARLAPHLTDQMVRERSVCSHILRRRRNSRLELKPCRCSAGAWERSGTA